MGDWQRRETLFRRGIFTNRPLLLAVTATVLLQMAARYAPPAAGDLPHRPPSPAHPRTVRRRE